VLDSSFHDRRSRQSDVPQYSADSALHLGFLTHVRGDRVERAQNDRPPAAPSPERRRDRRSRIGQNIARFFVFRSEISRDSSFFSVVCLRSFRLF
jgi:hypothetical protein